MFRLSEHAFQVCVGDSASMDFIVQPKWTCSMKSLVMAGSTQRKLDLIVPLCDRLHEWCRLAGGMDEDILCGGLGPGKSPSGWSH